MRYHLTPSQGKKTYASILCLFFAVFSFSSDDEPVALVRAPTPVLASSFRTGADVEAPRPDFATVVGFVDVERAREETPEIEAGLLLDKGLITRLEAGRASGVGVPAADIRPRAAEGAIDPSTRFTVEGVAGLEVEPIDEVESMVLTRVDLAKGVLPLLALVIDAVDDVDLLRSSLPLPPSERTEGGRAETAGVAAKIVDSRR
jgi:hypothetical protein